jgi:hypothetical protein
MSDITLTDSRYEVTRACLACQGEGVVLAAACPECGEPLTADPQWWQNVFLACGHETAVAEQTCQACGGNGAVKHILTEEEYQTLRRKKIVRGIFLLILGLLPFILLLIAIIAREPNLIFGNWWY